MALNWFIHDLYAIYLYCNNNNSYKNDGFKVEAEIITGSMTHAYTSILLNYTKALWGTGQGVIESLPDLIRFLSNLSQTVVVERSTSNLSQTISVRQTDSFIKHCFVFIHESFNSFISVSTLRPNVNSKVFTCISIKMDKKQLKTSLLLRFSILLITFKASWN